MSYFEYEMVIDSEGRRSLNINILPEKACQFDCVYCPFGRTIHKMDHGQLSYGHDNPEALAELRQEIIAQNPDIVKFDSLGEALYNDAIGAIIDEIHAQGKPVKLVSSGYVLNNPEYMPIANKCDEVLGEIRFTNDKDLHKYQRPIEGYTVEQYIKNMIEFRNQYPGRFVADVYVMRGVTDTDEEMQKLAALTAKLHPDYINIMRFDDTPAIAKAFDVPEETMEKAWRIIAGRE